ncbi:MAG: hypothetical protein AAB855_03130, partial [Patescibacteria group bacterium]
MHVNFEDQTGSLRFSGYKGGHKDIMKIAGNGNVGIGNNDPKAQLSVTPSGDNWNEGIEINPASNNYNGIYFRETAGSINGTWFAGRLAGKDAIPGAYAIARQGLGDMTTGRSDTPFAIKTDGTTLFGGNVGIGTKSPGYKLQVAGSISIDRDQALRAQGNWLIGQSASNNMISIGSTNVANDIRFDSSTAAGLMTVKADGNVVIGKGYSEGGITLGKDGMLQVGGDIELKGQLYRQDLQVLKIKNHTLVLNDGAPSATDAFIKVRNETSPDAQIRWNQTDTRWEIGPNLSVPGSVSIGSLVDNKSQYSFSGHAFTLSGIKGSDHLPYIEMLNNDRGDGLSERAFYLGRGSKANKTVEWNFENGYKLGIGGNVGIGTTDPTPTLAGARLLEIADDTDAVLGFRSTLAGTTRPEIRFSIGSFSNGNYDRAVLTTESNHDLAFYTNSALRAAILASGAFQIGTATVYNNSAKLLVHKEAEESSGLKSDVFRVQREYGPKDTNNNIVSDLAVDTRGVVAIGGDAPTGTDAKLFVRGKTISENFCIRKDGATDSCVADWNAVTPWRVNGTDVYYNTGNVGIGTTSPTTGKLVVEGLVHAG